MSILYKFIIQLMKYCFLYIASDCSLVFLHKIITMSSIDIELVYFTILLVFVVIFVVGFLDFDILIPFEH